MSASLSRYSKSRDKTIERLLTPGDNIMNMLIISEEEGGHQKGFSLRMCANDKEQGLFQEWLHTPDPPIGKIAPLMQSRDYTIACWLSEKVVHWLMDSVYG